MEQKKNFLSTGRIGSIVMIVAIIGAVALFIWGHRPIEGGGEHWDDLVSVIYIVYICVPVFLVGLVMAIVGRFRK